MGFFPRISKQLDYFKDSGGGGGPFLPLAGGTMSGDIDMGGNDITNIAFISGIPTLEISGQDLTLSTINNLRLQSGVSGFRADINLDDLTANRILTLPDATGVIALTSNLSAYLPLVGGIMTGSISNSTDVVIDPVNKILYAYEGVTTTPSYNWQTGILYSVQYQNVAIDLNNYQAKGFNGNTSIDWDYKWLGDGAVSLDWANKTLLRSGVTVTLNWDTCTLNDSDHNLSVHWINRRLISSGIAAVPSATRYDWELGIHYYEDGANPAYNQFTNVMYNASGPVADFYNSLLLSSVGAETAMLQWGGTGIGFSVLIYDEAGSNEIARFDGADTILKLQSTTKGFRPPAMTTTQKNAITGSALIAGIMVYDTTLNQMQYYNGTIWTW